MHTSSLVAIVVCAPSWANLQAATWLCNATEQGKNNISPREKKHNFLYSKLRRTNTHTTHTHRTGCGHDFALSCNTSLVLFQIFRVPPSCLICKCIWKHSKWATTGYVQQRPNIRLYLQISALHTLQHGWKTVGFANCSQFLVLNHFRSSCTYVTVMFFLPYYWYCRSLMYMYIYIHI